MFVYRRVCVCAFVGWHILCVCMYVSIKEQKGEEREGEGEKGGGVDGAMIIPINPAL